MGGVDARRLYQATGIAPQPINTVFQLMAERDLDRARHAVLVPDLMTYWLSGQLGTELTNASTTGLLDTRVMKWADQVAEALAVRIKMFPPLRTAGEVAGPAVPDLGLARPPQVIVGPSHDTAAAVAGVPAAEEGFAFVCTGTWALVGVELPAPVITEAARRGRFQQRGRRRRDDPVPAQRDRVLAAAGVRPGMGACRPGFADPRGRAGARTAGPR